ncbi:MAG TPA: cupin domain-containing protein [Euzebya sp.]|nr:cupin domain-containing protein [Euzebya sp.]
MTDDGGAPPQTPFQPTAVDLRDYVQFDLDLPTGRRVVSTDVLALDLICLEPQQTVHARTFSEADAVYTVLAGLAWIVTDEVEVTLSPLQALMIPAGVPHGVRNSSADPLILQVVTSPPDDVPVLPEGPAPQAAIDRAAAAARPTLLDRMRRTLGSSD